MKITAIINIIGPTMLFSINHVGSPKINLYLLGSVSVSYTHLDVYKRQIPYTYVDNNKVSLI